MKILLYGETHIIGSGAFFYAKAIKKLGHELFVYDDYNHLLKYKNNILFKIFRRLNKGDILSLDQKKHFFELLKVVKVNRPDIVIILKGLFLSNSNIVRLKKYSKFLVVVNHDDYFSFNRNNYSLRQLEALPVYDFIFVTRVVNINEVKRYNKNVDLLLFSYDSDIHSKHELSFEEIAKYKTDILFVGTFEKNRSELLEKLVKDSNFNLSIYGEQWHKLSKNSILRNYIKSYSGIWMIDMAKAIQVSTITLGFLRKENRDEYTQRTFEIPACGGLFLGEETDFQKSILTENEEAFYFDINNIDDLKNKINFILNNPIISQSVRINGHKKVVSGNFTYECRIRQIVDTYTKFISS